MGQRTKAACALLFVCATAAAEEAPGLELLEFLSQWHDGEGELLDPQMFDDDDAVPEREHEEGGDAAD